MLLIYNSMGTRIKLRHKKISLEMEEHTPVDWEGMFLKGFLVLAIILLVGLVIFCFWSVNAL